MTLYCLGAINFHINKDKHGGSTTEVKTQKKILTGHVYVFINAL